MTTSAPLLVVTVCITRANHRRAQESFGWSCKNFPIESQLGPWSHFSCGKTNDKYSVNVWSVKILQMFFMCKQWSLLSEKRNEKLCFRQWYWSTLVHLSLNAMYHKRLGHFILSLLSAYPVEGYTLSSAVFWLHFAAKAMEYRINVEQHNVENYLFVRPLKCF